MVVASTKEYEVVEQVKGSISQVARRLRDGAPIFVKRAKLSSPTTDEEQIKKRAEKIERLAQLDHNNVIKVFNGFEENGFYHLIVDYFAGAESIEKLFIRQEISGELFSEPQIALWGVQIARGLAYLHEQNIIHRDLEPSSCLVIGKRRIKISGFDFTQVYKPEDCSKATLVGSPAYWAPEIVKESSYDFKVDVWALGIILYQLANLRIPYDANCPIPILLHQIARSNPEQMSDHFSAEFRDLVGKLLDKEADTRPSMADVCKHEFLASALPAAVNTPFELQSSHVTHFGSQSSVAANHAPAMRTASTASVTSVASVRELDKLKSDLDAVKEKLTAEETKRTQFEEELKSMKDEMEKSSGIKSSADYSVTSEICKGKFSRVMLVTRKSDLAEFAAKEINLTEMAKTCANETVAKKLVDAITKDTLLLATLGHPNIVRIFTSFKEAAPGRKDLFYVIMECLDQNNLAVAIKTRNGKGFPEAVIHLWTKQLVSVVKYIHDRGFLHCSIKPRSVFLVNNRRTVKLGHFEIVKEATQVRWKTLVDDAKLEYNAPELWRDEPFTEKSDIWALGILVYELVCLSLPFVGTTGGNSSATTLMNTVLNSTPKAISAVYSVELRAFINKLLEKVPTKRLSSADAISDAFIKKAFKKVDELLNE